MHELVGDGHRDVEVGYRAVALAVNELEDVGVVHPQYPHVCPASSVVAYKAVRDVRMVLLDGEINRCCLSVLQRGNTVVELSVVNKRRDWALADLRMFLC